MDFSTTIETSLKQIEIFLGSKTFTYDGDSYLCHVGQQTQSTVLELGGFAETQQLVLIVRKSTFSDSIYPVADEQITYNDVVYFVDTVNADPSDTFINIALKRKK
jgi:hypothetical protein